MPEDNKPKSPQPDFGAFGVTPPDTAAAQPAEGPDFAAFGVEPEVEISPEAEDFVETDD